jgi:hypothetical protein
MLKNSAGLDARMALSPDEANEIASRYPIVRRDRLPELEGICRELNQRYPEVVWSADQRQFGVPDEEVEFQILAWFDVP